MSKEKSCDWCQNYAPAEVEYDNGLGRLTIRGLADCADPECPVELCPCCPRFVCEECGQTFCTDHKVDFSDYWLCTRCAGELRDEGVAMLVEARA